jgi:hypothetical protein
MNGKEGAMPVLLAHQTDSPSGDGNGWTGFSSWCILDGG